MTSHKKVVWLASSHLKGMFNHLSNWEGWAWASADSPNPHTFYITDAYHLEKFHKPGNLVRYLCLQSQSSSQWRKWASLVALPLPLPHRRRSYLCLPKNLNYIPRPRYKTFCLNLQHKNKQFRIGWNFVKFRNIRTSGKSLGNLSFLLKFGKYSINTGCFFHWASPKNTKSKIVLEYPNMASPGPPKKVKVYRLGLP